MRYADRQHAGEVLASAVRKRITEGDDLLVLGIPRGGVAVARPVAEALGADLDVAVARKLGAPGQSELAIGAVTPKGPPFLNFSLIAALGVGEDTLVAEVERQRAEASRREDLYRAGRGPLACARRQVVIVDDGVATGATVVAVARMVRAADAASVVVAVPVGAAETLAALANEADEVVCPLVPRWFHAVGEFYDDFSQLDDTAVLAVLRGGAEG